MTQSAIKNVTYYTATPVETCDRCGQGIKHVGMVTYKDGLVQKYGWDCIDRILASAPDLKSLYQKNAKLARKYRDYLSILTGPVADMPRGGEYFGSGLYFVADSEGKDIAFGHYFFHPVYDAEKNGAGRNYVVSDAATHVSKCNQEIAGSLPKLRAEIDRIEGFLARVLTKASAAQSVA